jgi:hypothetical protein
MLKTRLDTANEAPMAGPGRNIVFGGLDQNTVFVEGSYCLPPCGDPDVIRNRENNNFQIDRQFPIMVIEGRQSPPIFGIRYVSYSLGKGGKGQQEVC